MNRAFLISLVLVSLSVSQAVNHHQDGVTATKAGSCRYSVESGVVDNCILRDQNGSLFIEPTILKDLQFDRYGLAQVHSEENLQWMYVNRRGRVIITGVPNFDNWADEFSGGLVRTVVDGKYGFANRQGKIVIKPQFDWASPFEHGYAEVCNHCREACVMSDDCEHKVMTGGEWFKINKKGRIVAQLPSR